jgi:arylsulfatase A-like enzyme
LPIHHSEQLSADTGDDMDLRWNLISQKLALAGYTSYWYGKGHTGYRSMAHLPTHRDFKHWTGFMGGAQSYTATRRWQDEGPFNETTYSSDLYGAHTLAAIDAHDTSSPMMMYLPWQAVHAPYDVPPASDGAPNGTAVQQMLWSADQYVGKVVAMLKQKGMWANTLVVYTADNGGTADGCNFPGDGVTMCGGTNWPKRGNKHTNWQGGMNGAAFVSGGFVPAALRGTHSDVAMHIVDWYATFCALAGVDPNDESGVPPLPIDPDLPPTLPPPKDLYGDQSWPNMDGVNVWPFLKAGSTDRGAAHRSLALSREVLLVNGTFKLVVAQPDPSILAHKEGMPPRNNYMVGWRARNQTWEVSSAYDKSGCGLVFLRTNATFKPCLFNIENDPREMRDISTLQSDLMASMWKELNSSFLTWFHAKSPVDLLGPCNTNCSASHWIAMDRLSGGNGPVCGVPGCASFEN